MGSPAPGAQSHAHTRPPRPIPLGRSVFLASCPAITIFLPRLYFLSAARQLWQFTAVYQQPGRGQPKWNINYRIKFSSSNATQTHSTREFQSVLVTSACPVVDAPDPLSGCHGSRAGAVQMRLEGRRVSVCRGTTISPLKVQRSWAPGNAIKWTGNSFISWSLSIRESHAGE